MRAWEQYLKALEPELGKETITKWARSLKVLHFDAANLYLEAADGFAAQWFYEYLYPKARQKFRNENGRRIKIHLETAQKKPPPSKKQPHEDLLKTPSFIVDPLDTSFTFDRLVQSASNKIIFKLFSEFKKSTLKELPIYNPIYVYGPPGIGKTHLLQATAQLLTSRNIRACYVKLTTFMQNMVQAMKTSNMPEFRAFYRQCDVLIIDDIHHLAQKNATQEEFFHTFNALHMDGKQMIFSAQISPQKLEQIEGRLISRFEWGIVMPIKSPTTSELQAILQQKLKDVQIQLPDETQAYLIQHFSSSPQALSRALSALVLRAHLKLPQGQPLNTQNLLPDEAAKILTDLLKKEQQNLITVERILRQTAEYFGLQTKDILGRSQSRECVLPRQLSMYFCRQYLKLPYMKIGRIFARDHSTVMSSIKQVEKNAQSPSNNTAKLLSALTSKITSN